MPKVLIKNVIGGDVDISDIGERLKPGKTCEILGVSSIDEAMKIPSVKLHVIRKRLEIFTDRKEKSKSPKSNASTPKPKPTEKLKEVIKKIVPAKKRPKLYTKKDLMPMKMGRLRKIGKPLGARDTKKSELIAEILKAQKKL